MQTKCGYFCCCYCWEVYLSLAVGKMKQGEDYIIEVERILQLLGDSRAVLSSNPSSSSLRKKKKIMEEKNLSLTEVRLVVI